MARLDADILQAASLVVLRKHPVWPGTKSSSQKGIGYAALLARITMFFTLNGSITSAGDMYLLCIFARQPEIFKEHSVTL